MRTLSDELRVILKDTKRKYGLPQTIHFMRGISQQVEHASERIHGRGIQITEGYGILRQIAGDANRFFAELYPEVTEETKPQLMSKFIRENVGFFESYFDTSGRRGSQRKTTPWFINGGHIFETLIPVRKIYKGENSPPFFVFNNNAKILSLEVNGGRLFYPKQNPSFCIYGLDTAKFLELALTHNEETILGLVPSLLPEETAICFFINFYIEFFLGIYDTYKDDFYGESTSVHIGGNYKRMIRELKTEFLPAIINGHLDISTILNSLPLPSFKPSYSVLERFREVLSFNVPVRDENSFEPFIMMQPLLELLIILLCINKAEPNAQSDLQRISYTTQKYISRRLTQTIPDSEIVSRFTHIVNLLTKK